MRTCKQLINITYFLQIVNDHVIHYQSHRLKVTSRVIVGNNRAGYKSINGVDLWGTPRSAGEKMAAAGKYRVWRKYPIRSFRDDHKTGPSPIRLRL